MNVNTILFVYLISVVLSEDLPCIPKKAGQDSFVCVCNSTYCDTLRRMENPGPGKYIVYSSDRRNLRFKSSSGNLDTVNRKKPSTYQNANTWQLFDNYSNKANGVTMKIDIGTKYQSIFGFGGAVTDATCLNYMQLSEMTRDNVIRNYFATDGLEYNMLRVPIAGTDFSTHPYAYNDLPENDTYLTNYTLTTEDLDYKIPFLKQAFNQSTDEILIVSAAWSPPPWMKTNHDYGGHSMLLPEFYQSWALYHVKFLEEYKKEGVKIWAISTGNEPTMGLIPLPTFNTLGWTPDKQADWITNHLGPLLKSSEFSKVKLLAIDDQRFNLPWWLNKMNNYDNRTMSFIDGIALHFYWDRFLPPNLLDATMKLYPDKFLLGTEACAGSYLWDYPKVALGSWQRAELYLKNIIENLNHGYHAWIDWNLVLDQQGGPNWFNNFVDAPIISIPDTDEFYKQPLFYVMGHFSKFLPRGSTRVKVETSTDIPHVAFVTPTTPVVVIFYNTKSVDLPVTITVGNEMLQLTFTGHSINTVNIWPSIS